ncbi:HNH endonuclease [Pseudomonas sp. TNT11]|uniref:HNH endonuclease n=1 Tax=Pseudomonas emilianonis TaxID=2915812 RepID=A0ABT0ECC7_9PSED|nr:HNH endonuclease signature motif containing protein [Pseudomonas emilianonis]MCK1783382.1 HNH endonuclease [Pseudomonas emilianonis]
MHTSNLDVQALNNPAPRFAKSKNVAPGNIEILLSATKARRLFRVVDGKLVNLVRRGARAMPGMIAGSPNMDGYLRVKINNVLFRVHRVIWLITFGEWPKGQIDHINGIRDDNRIENLRDVTVQGNQRNQHIRTDNSSGVPGVRLENGKWRVRIKIDGKYICVGRFQNFDSAVAARKDAEAIYGFHPNHGATDSQRRGYSCAAVA